MEIDILDTGHWIAPWKFDVNKFVGFQYRITQISTNRQYIGKKFFYSITRKIVKNKKNRKKIIKESNWKNYCGSCKWLLSEIEKCGKEDFIFQIESLCESRSNLAWREVERLVKENVLREKLQDGSPKYFNGIIPPVKFKICEETQNEKEYKID
jgi:hypothetical protein